jgi:hypothetical protein
VLSTPPAHPAYVPLNSETVKNAANRGRSGAGVGATCAWGQMGGRTMFGRCKFTVRRYSIIGLFNFEDQLLTWPNVGGEKRGCSCCSLLATICSAICKIQLRMTYLRGGRGGHCPPECIVQSTAQQLLPKLYLDRLPEWGCIAP